MLKSSIKSLPKFYDRYIKLAPDVSILEALRSNPFEKDLEMIKKHQNFAYAPEKWTVNQIIRHCIDTERIMAYRALRFARKDQTELAGFSENEYAQHTETEFDIQNLLAEYQLVRDSSIYLFRSFTPSMLTEKGTASGIQISVLSLGFVIVGHPIHHANIIRERYLKG